MSGQYVRYLRHVRVCYLLLGWWYLALTARKSKWFMGNQERKKNMTKNKARKGLALGSALALAVTGLVATPAQAAGEIRLTVSEGTYLNAVVDSSFDLKAAYNLDAFFGIADEFLKFQIVDAEEGLDLDATLWEAATADADRDDDGVFTITTDVEGSTVASAGTETLTLAADADADAYDTGFSVTVQAWADYNNDGSIDSDEVASAIRTVNFVAVEDVDFALDFTTPEIGDTSLEASVTAKVDGEYMNLDQMGSISVAFGTVATNGSYSVLGSATESSDGVFTAGDAVTVDSGDKVAEVELSHSVPSTGNTYVAVVIYGGAEASGETFKVVSEADVDALTDEVTAGADVKDADTTTPEFRTGATALEYTVTAEDADADPVEGAVVTVTIAGTAMSADFELTAGGKTLTDATTDDEISFDVVTDEDGVATVAITLSGDEDAADQFTIAATSQGSDATGVTVDFTDTAADLLVDHNILGSAAVLKAEEEGTYTLRFAALDNFGQPLVGDYRVLLTGGYAADDADVVNGVATFVITDDADTDEAFTATLQEYNAVSRLYEDVTGASDKDATITPVIGTSKAAATVTVVADDTTDVALNTVDPKAANERLGETGPTSPTGAVALSGQVTDANGVGTYSMVTLSLAGAQFKADTPSDKDVWSVGSVTVMTNAAGAWSGVTVYSNVTGDLEVTATAGAATEVEEIEFTSAAADAGTSLVISAPASVMPGSTVIATATLTDDYGNPVAADGAKFDVAYDGPGLAVATPDEYDADGEAKIAYFLGANDTGTITVTFSYSPDGNADFDGDNDLVVQKTIYIGAAPSEEVATWTKNQNDGTVKMYAKNIVGAGKVQFMFNGEEIAWVRAVDGTDPKLRSANGFYYLVRTVELVEGQKNVFEIYVDGERTTRTAYSY